MRRKPELSPQVRVSNLWFRYPGSERDVLKALDLEAPRGKSLAIVGKNGSGKTTLVQFLCRLYDPAQGTIHYDDDLRQPHPARDMIETWLEVAGGKKWIVVTRQELRYLITRRRQPAGLARTSYAMTTKDFWVFSGG